MRKHLYLATCAVLVASGALADELPTGRQADRQLFGTRGTEGAVAQLEALSEQDRAILARVAQSQKYYGAIAVSPDEGLLSNATVAAANYHSVEPARAAALAECNDKRASGAARCIVGADILPRRYSEGRDLQLNMDASVAVGGAYRRLRGDKAFAISVETGHWGFGATDAEASASCAQQGADDCRIVIRN